MGIKIVIDPIANIYYSSFYIQGLYDKFGKKNVVFNSAPFINIANREDNFNFIITRDGIERKYSVHFDDLYKIKKELYDWCDVYGNVNTNLEKTPVEFYPKLVSLSPSFGIRIWNLPQTLYYCTSNLLKVNKKTDIRKFIGKYKRQYQFRIPLNQYTYTNPSDKHSKSIFHLSTLWHSDDWSNNDEGLNKDRCTFIRICKSIKSVTFEGGLLGKNDSSIALFQDVIYKNEMSISDYIDKTKRSVLVFNTPAFWSCHGWKLGEYLALGKAILSTPLSNDLPVPLVHGVNIHIVENNEPEIKKAVNLLLSDDIYRIKLEKGAREYWEKYGTPIKSLELLGI